MPFLLPSLRPYFLGLMASPRPTTKGKQIIMPCTYCGKTTHASEKCWKEFGKPKWDQAMSPVEPTIQMNFTPAEYEACKKSQASTSTANLASTSGTHAFLASRSSWVIDSGASAHMTGTPSTLSSLTPTTTYPLVSIADGRSCSVKGKDQPNLLFPLLHIMFYMFMAFPLTFFLLVPLHVHLIVLPFSTLSIVSSKTFVLAKELV